MTAMAQGGGGSTISCTDGAIGSVCAPGKHHWDTPTTQVTDAGSTDVFVAGKGAVRIGDAMVSHPDGNPCVTSPVNHAPTLSTGSPNVFVNNLPIGCIGDKFDSDGHHDHTIATSSQSTVFANGS
jgi:uncharacterized Zn-binding protein involved in type VI secretion